MVNDAYHGSMTYVLWSQGDGLTYPIRTVDEDYDSLLGQRQRWTEEADNDDGSAGL